MDQNNASCTAPSPCPRHPCWQAARKLQETYETAGGDVWPSFRDDRPRTCNAVRRWSPCARCACARVAARRALPRCRHRLLALRRRPPSRPANLRRGKTGPWLSLLHIHPNHTQARTGARHKAYACRNGGLMHSGGVTSVHQVYQLACSCRITCTVTPPPFHANRHLAISRTHVHPNAWPW